MKTIKRNDTILIVGAGTWGCSISLALARRGYENITVLDGHEFPSAIAAGNDINKIMEEGQKVSVCQAIAVDPTPEIRNRL
jgi:sarcosine oxidase / L-pipecolate oxidase